MSKKTGYYPRRAICKHDKTGRCEFANYNMHNEEICEVVSTQKKFNTSKKIDNRIKNIKRCPLNVKHMKAGC